MAVVPKKQILVDWKKFFSHNIATTKTQVDEIAVTNFSRISLLDDEGE